MLFKNPEKGEMVIDRATEMWVGMLFVLYLQ